MIFGIGDKFSANDIDELKRLVIEYQISEEKIIHLIPLQEEKILSPNILRNSTYFITNKDFTSVECLDWLWDTNVKVVSAMDDGIFEGEPKVDWKRDL